MLSHKSLTSLSDSNALTVPYNFLNSSNSLPSTMRAMTDRISRDCLRSVGAMERSSFTSYNGSLNSWFTVSNLLNSPSFPGMCKFLMMFHPRASPCNSSTRTHKITYMITKRKKKKKSTLCLIS